MRTFAAICLCLVHISRGRRVQINHDPLHVEQAKAQKVVDVFRGVQPSPGLDLQPETVRQALRRSQGLALLLLVSNAAIAHTANKPTTLLSTKLNSKDTSTHGFGSLLQEARGNRVKMMNAYRTLKKKLDADPESTSLKLACAEALVSVMRIVGHANGLTCHFKKGRRGDLLPEIKTSDTSENKALWAELAPTAQRLLADVERSVGKDVFSKEGSMYSLGLEACMYAVASKGIIAAVVSGKAPSFLRRVTKFEKNHKEWDGSQYCIYRGAYLEAAPKPVYDPKKALEYFELAAKKSPRSKRNQYFAGVGRFAVGDFTGARQAMEKALREPCSSQSETDICDWLSQEITRTIEMLKEKGY